MPRCFHLWSKLVPGLVAAGILLAGSGCNYESKSQLVFPGESPTRETGKTIVAPRLVTGPEVSPVAVVERDAEKAAILDNVIKLVRAAGTRPGGGHFGNATRNLNQYFEGTPSSDFALDSRAREYLLAELSASQVATLEATTWAGPDARHLEDCMLYQGIASRVGGAGDDLTRVRRVFDWIVQQIQLVPPGGLAAPGLGQAEARPFDVLVRGMATEGDAGWSERGWVFLSFCRQLGLDAGLVTYTPLGAKAPVVWCAAVLIDKKAYLFDPRLGLPIPGPRGEGVATLDDAMTDPRVLDRMDLNIADQPAYVTRGALLASPTRIGVLLDSSLHYFCPRMKLLQQRLAGKDLTVLYRDPAEQRDRFTEALGRWAGKVGLWSLPIKVETHLFNDSRFVEATAATLELFRPELPLVYARMMHLRGEIPEAIQAYVALRFAENPTLLIPEKRPIPDEVQKALDVYATYYLGMCHLDQKHAPQAEFFFEKTLELLPEPGPRRPYFYMFRWGAQGNLARLKEVGGDRAQATAYYSLKDPTPQRHGNLLRARDLVWLDPLAPLPAPLPAAPPETSGIQAAAADGK